VSGVLAGCASGAGQGLPGLLVFGSRMKRAVDPVTRPFFALAGERIAQVEGRCGRLGRCLPRGRGCYQEFGPPSRGPSGAVWNF
jgi:hypothetical protein